MTNYLIVPGLGDSGPDHWQTYFEESGEDFSRIQQDDWNAPLCEEWISRIDEKVKDYDPSTVVLIGHSLGCSSIAHWSMKYQRKIKGAMLVAPSDPEADVYTFPARGFAPVPLERIPFPTIVVASNNDVWVTLERASFFAEHWGSEFVDIGAAGHINAGSGHHRWEEGLEILKRLS